MLCGYRRFAEDVETRFDISNYQLDRPLPKEIKKKVNGLMKVELGEKNHDKICWIKSKNLINGGSEDKKVKDIKECVIKGKLKSENYKNCLEATQLENKINYLEKNKININSFLLQKNHKKFIKNNKLILKHSKKLELKGTMLLLKKLIRFL